MKTLSLRLKLYVFFIGLLLLLGVGLIATAQKSVNDMGSKIKASTENNMYEVVQDQLDAAAGMHGEKVSKRIDAAFKIPLVTKSIIEHNMSLPVEKRLSREALKDAIGSILAGNKVSNAIYAHFEPNSYDTEDTRYYLQDKANTVSSDSGVFELYFEYDTQGDVKFGATNDSSYKYDESLDEFGNRKSEWYLCSKDSGKPCLLEPFEFKNQLMTSLAVPLIKEGKFMGVAGIDINLSALKSSVHEVSRSLFDGQARVTLLSQKGLIMASSHYESKLMRPLKEAMPKHGEYLTSLHEKGKHFDDGTNMFVSYKIRSVDSGANWALLIELPKNVALRKVNNMAAFIDKEIGMSALEQIVVGSIILLVGIAIVMLLVRSVIKPINAIRKRMQSLAKANGDLTQKIHIEDHAELIDLAAAFNAFLGRLRNMVNDLKEVGRQVGEQTHEVSNVSNETERQLHSQYQDIESVVTAMNEMSVSASEVAGIAKDASHNASSANKGVVSTQKTLDEAVQGVDALAGDMGQASEAISHVAQRSEEINQILDVIRGIAEQTNLLALNAAIEAARAGEQGRGFAVVADEVRTLASRTRESTDEITNMIEALKSEVDSAVNIIQSGASRASHAVEGTTEANQSLVEVVERINGIVSGIDQVATAASEQSTVSEEINQNLTQIGDSAKDLQGLAHQVKSSGDELGRQVNTLDRELGQLKT